MTSTDATHRVCQFPDPNSPSGICGAPLSGRGRYRWCPKHEEMAHQLAKKARNPVSQQRYREKNREAYLESKRIYRRVARALKMVRYVFPSGSKNIMRAQIHEVYRLMLDESFPGYYEKRVFYLPLPNEVHAYVFVKVERERVAVVGGSADKSESPPTQREEKGHMCCWFLTERKWNESDSFEDDTPAWVTVLPYLTSEVLTRSLGWNRDGELLVIPLISPGHNMWFYFESLLCRRHRNMLEHLRHGIFCLDEDARKEMESHKNREHMRKR